ncbi:MAG: ferritin-like domain-containing protein [Sediminibacterium sp.]
MYNDKKRSRYIAPIREWAEATRHSTPEAKHTLLKAGQALKSQTSSGSLKFKVPSEFNGKDYITMLLHIDAEIEQGLMIQYLYSAYSLGGPQIAEKYREQVHSWQNIILGIAKEEMGHFVSVQNVLKVIGAPLNFGRESYPWDSPFYPFPFTLEKFSLDSLAKYIYAEAPTDWLQSGDPLAKEIIARVNAQVSDPHTVGALFKVLLQLINDPEVISDETFKAATYPYQAKFDEWGRGYTGGSRGSDGKGMYTKSPDVLVAPLLSRDDAYNALSQIAEQGEGEDVSSGTPSHFERFLHIYKEYKFLLKESGNTLEPARNVATNPYTGSKADDAEALPTKEPPLQTENDRISNPEAVLWAQLFDIRYRLLLNFLNHSFLLDNGLSSSGASAPRGLIINSAFGEMYNLKSISGILVQKPLAPGSKKMAGPTFTLPYTFDLPFGEPNRWKVHQDLIEAALNIIHELKQTKNQQHIQYLNALQESDNKLLQSILLLTETWPA